MPLWRGLSRPTNEPGFSSFLVLVGATLIGSWIGEALFSRSYGLPRADGLLPWWYSILFALAALLLLLRFEGRMLRIALGLLAARHMLAAADATLLHGQYRGVGATLLLVVAAAFALAGWPAAHRWARALACVLCVVAIPVRYRMLQTVHGVRSVVNAGDRADPTDPGPRRAAASRTNVVTAGRYHPRRERQWRVRHPTRPDNRSAQ